MLNERDGWKNVSVGTLREILASLPADARVGLNEADNLLIVHNGSLLGYVDLMTEQFVPYAPGMMAS